jgi:hypothetical protein
MLFTKEKLLVILIHLEKVNKNNLFNLFSYVLLIDLTQAMLLQESQGLREALARVKNSPHAPALADEIRQAESLLNRLK